MPFFIEIEGCDGCGKQTQSNFLKQELTAYGIKTKLVSFPNYDNESSTFVKKYLNGEYTNMTPMAIALLYTMDRLISYHNDWGKDINDYDVVIFDRYTSSNVIYQAAKAVMDNGGVVKPFEENHIATEIYDHEAAVGLPKVNMSIFLDVPYEVSKKLRAERANKIDGSSKKDINEANDDYMKIVTETAKRIVSCNSSRWTVIDCTSFDGKYIRFYCEIAEEIKDRVLDEYIRFKNSKKVEEPKRTKTLSWTDKENIKHD